MRSHVYILAVLLAAVAMLAMHPGCCTPTGGDDPNSGADPNSGTDPNSGSGATPWTIVKTSIVVRHDSALRCGDDLIAFGQETDGSAIIGVYYVIPSTTPTVATPVTNTALYCNYAFAVGGKTIFLAGSNTAALMFQISVYDVTTAAITKTYPTTDIRLGGIPVGSDTAGHIRADGDYCVVRCDQGTVTDGKIVKVIDVSGATPALIAFAQNPATTYSQVKQMDVDAATKKVVAVANDSFFIYDIDDPNAAPTEIPVAKGIGDQQIEISGNYIIAQDDEGYESAFLVDLTTNTVIELTAGLAQGDVAIGGTTFAFFANADATDGGQRTSVGTAPGPGFTKAATGNQIDGSTNNNGKVGFASDMCIVPDGSYIFLSGAYFQYSAGTASFTVPGDVGGTDPYATPAWDIDCSSNTVGFQTNTTTSASTDKTLGYIILN